MVSLLPSRTALTPALVLALALNASLSQVARSAVSGASQRSMPAARVVDDGADPTLKKARELAAKVVSVPSNELRTKLFGELIEVSGEHSGAADCLRESILEIWKKSNRRLGSRSNLRAFAKLVKARKKLDELRASTLELIRDEILYPYPCELPEATPEAIHRFRQSQQKIDEAVEEMRTIWRKSPRVKIPRLMAEHLELALWTRRANSRAGKAIAVSVKLPRPDLPTWVYGLPFPSEVPDGSVTLESFGTSLVEAKFLATGRAIRRLNGERLEAALEGVTSRFTIQRLRAEFDQVRVTNDYRQLFGLQVLAWDDRLFQACRQHAEYVWETGDFGHDQPTVEFASFQARARRVGYPTAVYENLHSGSNEPFDVLDALTHSSEHHRTILLEIVTEMATARSGLAWVQNYGLDTGFRSAIQWEAWRD